VHVERKRHVYIIRYVKLRFMIIEAFIIEYLKSRPEFDTHSERKANCFI